MDLNTWLVYLLAAIGLSLSPGPNGLLALTHGALHGRRQTLHTIAGGALGFVALIALSMFGIGALLQASVGWLTVLKWLGGAYLVWLGVQKWRSAAAPLTAPAAAGRNLLLQGLLVNLGNPKAIVFMVALLPQFIDPDRSQWMQMAVMGVTTCGIDIIAMSGYALLATSLRPWLSSPQRMAAQNRVFGGIFVVAGSALAISGQRH